MTTPITTDDLVLSLFAAKPLIDRPRAYPLTVKFLGPSNSKPARLSVHCDRISGDKRVTYSYHDLPIVGSAQSSWIAAVKYLSQVLDRDQLAWLKASDIAEVIDQDEKVTTFLISVDFFTRLLSSGIPINRPTLYPPA